MLVHRLHLPAAPVSRFVENMWLVRGRVPQPTRQMLLPDGAIVVIVNLGEPQRLCERADVRRHAVFKASWVSGQQPQPIVIEQSGSYHLAGIRFRPGGAFPLFRFSIAELTGRVIELEDIWGSDAAELRSRCDDAAGDLELLVCLERWLAARLRREAGPDRRISFAAEMLRRGGTGVGRLAEVANLSHKHFVHEFERRVGLAPKQFGRVQRLQRTIAAIGSSQHVNWPAVALASGFYDQAHLINEFQDLIGLAPTDYLARRSPHPGYLHVA
ncbi:MAG TPA: DUF6597 domain-containing transcriptional factor [Candidatus Didemnitutus sp.]|nr:DUF6597 domain-containing transcriptional factor [Candidatus Didemnitutus sp.]